MGTFNEIHAGCSENFKFLRVCAAAAVISDGREVKGGGVILCLDVCCEMEL